MRDDGKKFGGRVFANRYEIMNLLGSGGMGSVFIAKDRFLDGSLVAIKILHKQLTGNPEFVQRFLREVKAMRMVSHPNVIRTFDAGEVEGNFYYTMECLRGTPLSELIHEHGEANPLPWASLERIIRQILQGLKAIHAENLIHRDLKPDNIFLEDEDVVKITDFGVVRTKNSSLTQTDAIIGTLHYVAPEIWAGESPTLQSDLYALGILTYELLTGDLPFPADNPADLMRMHLSGTPVAISKRRPDVPKWVDILLSRMLAKTLEERAATADVLLDLLSSPPKNMPSTSRAPQDSQQVVPSNAKKTLRNDLEQEVDLSNALREQLAADQPERDLLEERLNSSGSRPAVQAPPVSPQAFTSSNGLQAVGLQLQTSKKQRSNSMIMIMRAFGAGVPKDEAEGSEEVHSPQAHAPLPSGVRAKSFKMMLRGDRQRPASPPSAFQFEESSRTPSYSRNQAYKSGTQPRHQPRGNGHLVLVMIGVISLICFLAFPRLSEWMHTARSHLPAARTQVGP